MRKDWKHRKEINEEFFNLWSKDFAWFLGHAQADACIHQNKTKNRLSYCISPKDIEILEFIIYNLCPSKKINNKNIFLKKTEKKYNLISLYIDCKSLIEKMIQLGVKPNKTGNEKFPSKIPSKMIRHYIRGYFDGDGSVGIYKYDNKSIKYNFQITCASKEFLEILKSYIGFGNIRKRENIYDLVVSSKYKIAQIHKYLYEDDGFFLKRKKNIFDCILEDSKIPKQKTGPKTKNE